MARRQPRTWVVMLLGIILPNVGTFLPRERAQRDQREEQLLLVGDTPKEQRAGPAKRGR